MAKKRSSTGKISSGNRKTINIKNYQKKMAKFTAKRENGNAYSYKPNPYKEGSYDWRREQVERANKAKSPKLPYAFMRSMMQKLENGLEKDKEKALKKSK